MPTIDQATWDQAARANKFHGTGYTYFLAKAPSSLLTYHGLAAYWSMNAIIAGQVPDLSSQGNHATLLPSYPTDSPQPVPSFDTKFGNALSFNGTTVYASPGIATGVPTGNADRTLECWLKPLAPGPFDTDIALWLGTDDEHNVTGIGIRTISRLFTCLFWADDLNADIPADYNTWYHLCATYHGATRSAVIYINGRPHGSKTLAAPLTSAANVVLGHDFDHARKLPGLLDEVRIYTRALSQEEISRHYHMFT